MFPKLSKRIHNDKEIINILSHNISIPAQCEYVYDNNKYHGGTRDEIRLYINENVNPEKKVYLKDDIIIIYKSTFMNDENMNENVYIVTRYRESIERDDYTILDKILSTQIIELQKIML